MKNRTLSSEQRSLSMVTKIMRKQSVEQDGDMTLEGEVGGEVYTVSNLRPELSIEESVKNASMNKKLELNVSEKEDGMPEPY